MQRWPAAPEPHRPVGGAVAPPKQQQAQPAEHDVRQPRRDPGRHHVAPHERLAEPEQHVVDEDDADADDEARQLAVAAVGGAERQADQAEHQARKRNRELLLDLEQLAVRIDALASRAPPPAPAAAESTSRWRPAPGPRAETPSRDRALSSSRSNWNTSYLPAASAVCRAPSSSTISTVRVSRSMTTRPAAPGRSPAAARRGCRP